MKSNIFKILKKEIRETIRDKKSLMMMFLTPFMAPLLVVGLSLFFETVGNPSIEDYNKIGITYETTEAEKKIIEELEINPIYDTYDNLKKKYEKGEVSLYISKEGNTYTMHGEYSDNTTNAEQLATLYLEAYKTYLQADYLEKYQINPLDIIEILTVKEDIVIKENPMTKAITQEAFLFVIMSLTMAAIYAATDSIAGEKEKGTLETLLTFPVKAKDIIVGKFLSISISSFIAGIVSFLLMIIALIYADGAFSVYEGMNLIPSFISIVYSIVILLIYAFFVSGLCIAVASKTKTYKEAQSALTPISVIVVVPGLIATLATIKTTPVLAMVPFLNISLLYNDILLKQVDILHLVLAFITSILLVVVVLAIIIKQYKSEKVLFSN